MRLVVGQSPGGATDLVARVVAQKLTDSLGQSVIVDNRTGAAGSVGAALVAKSLADGYTLLVVSSSFSEINPSLYTNLPFHPLKDFTPITLIAQAPFLLVVTPSLPARTVGELIAAARSKPGTLNYGSGGNGSSGHLAGELFKNMANISMVHVPYKGAGPALIDVMAGQVQLTFGSVISSLTHVRSGKLRALAVTSAQRSKSLPDLPTVSEAGVGGYHSTTWYGMLAPAGTPPSTVAKLNSESKHVLGLPDVQQRFSGDGAEPVGDSPTHFRKFLDVEIAKWRTVVKAANIQGD